MKWQRHLALALALVLLAGCSQTSELDEELSVVYNQQILEVGETHPYRFQIHCGMEWLGEFNATNWVTDDPMFRGSYPEDLREFFANPDEQISPELWTHITLMAEDEIRLTLPDGSRETVYRPTDAEWPGCA